MSLEMYSSTPGAREGYGDVHCARQLYRSYLLLDCRCGPTMPYTQVVSTGSSRRENGSQLRSM
jgi:hypothetical protein